MRITRTLMFAVLTIGALALPTDAAAQVLGTFRWQQSPYCNLITLTVVQVGGVYQLSGFDDECGGPLRGAVTGTAFLNGDGSIGMGFTVVTPSGRSFQVDAAMDLSTLSGPWRSSTAASGTWVFTPGPRAPGSARPQPSSTLVVESAGIAVPANLSTQARIEDLNERVVVPQGGRLSITKTLSNATVLCSGIAAGFFFITIDGTPIRNSAVYANGGFSGALTGVTVNPVAAGAHVIGIGMHCFSGAVTGGGHNLVSISSVTVLP